LRQDEHGNLLITRPGRIKGPRWVFAAHMDHPGLVASKMAGKGRLQARFRGGVLASHLPRTPVVFFAMDGVIRGRITRAMSGDRGYATGATIQVEGIVPPGTPGMFDLEVTRQRGKLLHNRAIDDLGGVAAVLQAIVNLKSAHVHAAVLLTRAEEDGFIGAIAAARDGKIIRQSDSLLSIETSAQQPVAQQGKGVVIRVGDKASVFDSGLTYQITQLAQGLAAKDKSFAFQRALMPGGVCEATAFDAYGYRAAALCIPLGNYHNMVPGKKKIAAEYIHLDDWQCLVDLLTAIGSQAPAANLGVLKDRLEKRFARQRKYL
jgi:endoglucanase